MRINVAVPEAHVQPDILNAALESVTRLNESLLARDQVPSFDTALKYGIKWKPEPPGAEHFDHAATVLNRKWGDCDDLAPYQAASLRHSGEDPHALAVVKRSGPKTWHAVVQRSDGSIDDPSLRAGMRAGIAPGVRGATVPKMTHNAVVGGAYIVRPQIALRPVRGGFQARADLPWHWKEHLEDKPTPTDYALTALHTAPVASTALTGAIDGACFVAGLMESSCEDHISGLACLAEMCDGATPEDLLDEGYNEEHVQRASQVVGSFFSHLSPLNLAHSLIHNPFANAAASFFPGGGAAFQGARGLEHMMHPGHPSQHPGYSAPPGARGMRILFE